MSTYEKVNDRIMRLVEDKTVYTPYTRCTVEERLETAQKKVSELKALLVQMDKLDVKDITESDI